jgi:uncharacterized protein YndB with AHSA1/START domain
MTTIHHPETTIEIDEKVPLVRIIREFDAPAEAVFRAHTEADLYKQWLGPRDLEMTVETFDCRTGGEYRYIHSRGDERYAFRGCYHEVTAPNRIVQTFTYEDWPEAVALETMVIEDLPGGRSRLTATSLVDSFEGRDGFVASGMETGINEGYDKLDELLATL